MYPNLYYAFKDLFGVDWKILRFINSFGFFVAISFLSAWLVLGAELKRKEKSGFLQSKDEKIIVGKPASLSELFTNFIFGFLVGYKFIGLFLSDRSLNTNPQDFILSLDGSWPAGFAIGLFFSGLKWWEKNKQKLPQPEERVIRIWPHDRVGDMTMLALIFGFAGAKIFNSLETWNDFIRNPLESLFSFSGLTFYGGLICAAFAIAYYGKKHKMDLWHLADCFAPSMMLAYGVGRIGCQVSGDGDWGILNSAYCSTASQKVTLCVPGQFQQILARNSELYISQFGSLDVPHLSVKTPSFLPNWLFAYSYPHNVLGEGVPIPGCSGQYCNFLPLPVFPTPIYETVICLGLFFVLWSLRKRMTIPGTIAALYLILNGTERFFIEKIRVNTKYSIFGYHPTQAELISFLLILSGIGLLIFLYKRKPRLPVSQGV
jgi:phosphatidylglycerol---prolipoprotein diacylglyceryl transferase